MEFSSGFRRARHGLTVATALASVIALASPALAQDSGTVATDAQPDIIVTATKRASTIQDVPFSINAQSEKDIERANAVTLEDLSRNVAGLTIQNLGPGQSQVAIRGVSAGQIVRDQPGVKEQVGVYLDESVISLSLFTPDLDLFDLNRVETLRGPQGTLFGSGSVGGTIRYITNQPNTDRMEGKVEANINLVDEDDFGGHIKGAINMPLSDSAAIRAVGYYTRYGGFIDALREGGKIDKNVNDGWRAGGRLSMLLQASDNISITPRVIYQKVHTNGFNRQEVFNLFANPFTTTRPAVTFKERQQFLLLNEDFSDETFIADGTIAVGLGGVDLTSITSYTHRDILVSRDASSLTGSVSIDLGFPTAAVTLPSNLRDTTKVKQFTQEVRLSSNGDGPLQWLVGGFYSHTDREYNQRLPTPGYAAFQDAVSASTGSDEDPDNDLPTAAQTANGFDLNSPFNSSLPYKLRQTAAFGEVTYAATDQLKLTVGGRYYDYKETRTILTGGLFAAGGPLQADKTSSNGFTPRILASFDASDAVTLNAQISKGFRLGGVNDPLNTALCSSGDLVTFGSFQSYDDETLWNYEAGIKTQTRGLTFNAAVFYTDIKNLQVTLDAGSCSSRISFNVPKAHSVGLEWELSARPVQGLDLSLSGSVLESKFDSTVRAASGAVLGGVEDGNRLPSVPKFQLSANAEYSFPLDGLGSGALGVLNAGIQHVGNRFTQPSDQVPGAGNFSSGLAFGGATGNEVMALNLKLPSYQIVSVSAGLELANQLDISLYVTNLFDENALLSFDRERNGRARLGFATNQPRTIGITVRKGF